MDNEFPHGDEASSAPSSPSELNALQTVIGALHPLDDEARRRIFESVATFLRIQSAPSRASAAHSTAPIAPTYSQTSNTRFSEDTSMSPKEFLLEKEPRTDVERIACLAYYLTHYRATPHFKTLDLSMLNTEAAQPKFANTAYSSNNAVKMGYLVPSTKGQRQVSAIGERFVRALPDREAAKAVLDSLRRRPRAKKSRGLPVSLDGT
jgi:hypothetical protein